MGPVNFIEMLLSSPSAVALSPSGSPLLIYVRKLGPPQPGFDTPHPFLSKWRNPPPVLQDVGNNVIRAVWQASGEITHWCGNASGIAGYGGDNGPAALAALSPYTST